LALSDALLGLHGLDRRDRAGPLLWAGRNVSRNFRADLLLVLRVLQLVKDALGDAAADRLDAERALEVLGGDGLLAEGHALDRLVLDAGLVARVGDALERAPLAPREAEPAALVEARVAREADAGRLPILLGKEAAARALLARVDVAAAAGAHNALGVLDGEDAAGAVDAGLRRLELGLVEGGVLEPVDRGHGERCLGWGG